MTETPSHSASDQNTDLPSTWPVSLCFWLTLMVAAVVYSGVALAPKFSVWDSIRQEFRQNARQLGSLESDVVYLERVESALKTDPEFVERLANVTTDGGIKSSKSESVPVSGNLLFGQDSDQYAEPDDVQPPPPYHNMVQQLASNRSLRAGLLCFAACLTIFAFTFLNDAGTELVQSAGNVIQATLRLPVSRYFAAMSQHADVDGQQPLPESPQTDGP